jgi:hypothetical protein
LGYEEPWVEQLSLFTQTFVEKAIFSLNLIPSGTSGWKPHPLTAILLEAASSFRSVSVTAELTSLYPGGLPALGTAVTHRSIVQFLKTVHPDVRGAVMQALTSSGAPGTFEAVLGVLKHAQLPADRRSAISALCLSKFHHERIRVLQMAIESDDLTHEESLLVIEHMAMNHESRATTWRKVKDNWILLQQRYSHYADGNRFIMSVVSPFASLIQYHDIKDFFDSHPHKGVGTSVKLALETVKNNADWLREHSGAVEKFLQDFQTKETEDLDTTPHAEGGAVEEQEKDEDLLQLPLRMSVAV